MTAAEPDTARHGDFLLMFGKMLENGCAGGKPFIDAPLLKQPREQEFLSLKSSSE
jgi:hypothetical protein